MCVVAVAQVFLTYTVLQGVHVCFLFGGGVAARRVSGRVQLAPPGHDAQTPQRLDQPPLASHTQDPELLALPRCA